MDSKIHECASPLYKMVENNAYSKPSASANSQIWVKNTVFNPSLVEFMDVKPGNRKDWLYLLKKIVYVVEPHKLNSVQGSVVVSSGKWFVFFITSKLFFKSINLNFDKIKTFRCFGGLIVKYLPKPNHKDYLLIFPGNIFKVER